MNKGFSRLFLRLIPGLIPGLIAGLILGVVMPSNQALAWGAKGHVLITAYAYDHLNKNQQETLNNYAELLLNQLDDLQQLQLFDTYSGTPLIAKLSFLPDRYKDMSLKNLFITFKAPLPKNLEIIQYQNTTHWHYIDYAYPTRPNCLLAPGMNLISAVKALEVAWENTPNTENYDRTRAVIILLFIHLIEDAHQPLHMFSHTTANCKQDAGGNLRTIMNKNHRRWRLHQWWDDAGGLFNRPMPWPQRIGLLDLTPNSGETDQAGHASQDVKLMNISNYLVLITEENSKLIPWIYSQSSSRPMSEKYRQQSQRIALAQMRIAGQWLQQWLNTHI